MVVVACTPCLFPAAARARCAASNQSLSSGRRQNTVERRWSALLLHSAAAVAAADVVECFSRQFFNVWLVSD